MDLSSGNYFFHALDASIARPGLPINFERYYSSQGVAVNTGYNGPGYQGLLTQPNIGKFFTNGMTPGGLSGPLGFGWTDSFNAHLIFGGPGAPSAVTSTIQVFGGGAAYYPTQIYMPDGSFRAITQTSSGTYAVDPRLYASFAVNSNGTYSLTFKDKTLWVFNAQGQLQSETDRNGNQIGLGYSNGDLMAVTDSGGNTVLSFAYNSNNEISTMTDVLGRVWSYSYDGTGNLSGASYPGGLSASYGYDQYSNLTSVNDPRAPLHYRVVNNSYGILNSPTTGATYVPYVTQQTNGLGQAFATYSYGSNGSTPGASATVKDADGNVTASTFSTGLTYQNAFSPFNGQSYGNGCLLTQTDALGHTASIQYADPINPFLVSVATDKNGHATTHRYDNEGNTVQSVDALGAVTSYSYEDSYNQLTATVDAYGHTNTWSQSDGHGNLQVFTDALKKVTTFAYNAAGQIVTRTDPNVNAWTFAYDSYGNMYTASDPLGHTNTYNRDAGGRLLSSVDANNNATSYTLTPADEATQITYADGTFKQYAYDSHENVISYADQNGEVTSHGFNSADELTQSVDPMGHKTSLTYDAQGNPLTVTDANGHAVTDGYDGLNRIHTETDALGKVTTYTYDPVGNRVQSVDGNGHTRAFIYDADNRLTGDGPDTYTYDLIGNRTGMDGTTTDTYDADQRLISVANPGGVNVNYVYDSGSRRTSLQVQKGGTILESIAYTYDSANRLATTVSDDGTTQFAFDAAGNLLTQTDPNGVVTTRTYNTKNYDLAGLDNTDAAGEGVSYFDYTYDKAGNRLTERNLLGETDYTYDADYELTQAVDADGNTETYTYDAVGNRLASSLNSQAMSYSVNAANEMTSVNGVACTYDANGNQTSKGSVAYTWDIKNRLSAVGGFGYAYDGNNLRVQKTVGSALKVQYYYDGMTPILELDGNGNVLKRYNPGISFATGQGKHFFYAYNGHGDVADLTDTHGNLVQSYQYTAFGALANGLTDKFNGSRYAGQYGVASDDDAGLEYMGMRWYDPATGRFICQDPIGFLGGDINLYRYCGNDPINHVDSLGLAGWWGAAIGALVGGWNGATNAFHASGGNVSKAILGGVLGAIAGGFTGFYVPDYADVSAATTEGSILGQLFGGGRVNWPVVLRDTVIGGILGGTVSDILGLGSEGAQQVLLKGGATSLSQFFSGTFTILTTRNAEVRASASGTGCS